MANHASSKKRIRRNAARAGSQKDAKAALQAAQPELQRGVAKGIFHKNTAARKLSRLSARIKTLK